MIDPNGFGKCDTCGNSPVSHRMVVCPTCGARLPWADQLRQQQAQAQTSANQPPNQWPTSQAPPQIFNPAQNGGSVASAPQQSSLGWVVVLLLVIGVAAFFVLRSANNDMEAKDNPDTTVIADGTSQEELEQWVLTSYNERLKAKDAPFSCTKISLIEETPNKYVGFAELTNGSRPDVTVNVAPNGDRMYRIR